MMLLLSPAKTLNESHFSAEISVTSPCFWEQAKTLAQAIQKLSPAALGSLMKTSEKITNLNVGRYQNFPETLTKKNSFPALHCFQGDVYRGIDDQNFSAENWQFAQTHVRILSGLYGILRPLDQMYPYRLEMGTNFPNVAGKNLYEFWGDKITERINFEMSEQGSDTIINLASQEYFKAVRPEKIRGKIIHIEFREAKAGAFKIVAIHAKRARGLMTQFVIENEITNPAELTKFAVNNYQFHAKLSTENVFVFTR